MGILLRPLVLSACVATALLPVAAPAGAQTAADFEDARVEVFPGCAGLVRTVVSVSPLPTDVAGVRAVVLFKADRHDPACAVTTTVGWRNVDSGASGSEELTVSSVPEPGGFLDPDHGYGWTSADTGPGRVVVTVSTNPGEVSIIA
uniref:hypothetical protein n=1 Tax=Nocardia donostiensis TaxID=1538463 RepID=UPI00111C47CB|nr:hypothetical protein [Nocardia donostiensis]